jgi:hypothetical protein
MTLPEVFQLEGIPNQDNVAFLVVGSKGHKMTELRVPAEWTKAADGCWYAEGWRFIPAIAKLGDLQGAFDHGQVQINR